MFNTAETFQPCEILQLELSGAPLRLPESHDDGCTYHRASVLLRLHGHPVASIEIDPNEINTAEKLSVAIWSNAARAINRHLKNDGLATIESLPPTGLPSSSNPACWSGAPANGEWPFISVVIATKDRAKELTVCLDGLLRVDYPSFEVIVVENGSTTNETANIIADLYSDDPRVRYVYEERAGVSHARNRGTQEARGEIVAFTDDDVIVDPMWLHALARRFLLRPDVDCVTGLVIPAQCETQAQAWFEEFGGFNKGFRTRTYTKRRFPGASFLYPYCAGMFGSGNNSAFRREALIRRGAFDERLGPGTPARGGEDLDAFLNVLLDDGVLAYEPAAIIAHFHRDSYEALRKQIRDYGIGLSAMITKHLLAGPGGFVHVIRRIPLGIWTVLNPKSKKNAGKSSDYPAELSKAELRGMLRGPDRYIRSLLRAVMSHSRTTRA